jgi:hypothetical protein
MRKRSTTKKEVVIKTVHFRANLAPDEDERFQHIHIEAVADVHEGFTPRQVLDALKTFVHGELQRAAQGEAPAEVRRPGRFRASELTSMDEENQTWYRPTGLFK